MYNSKPNQKYKFTNKINNFYNPTNLILHQGLVTARLNIESQNRLGFGTAQIRLPTGKIPNSNYHM